MAIKILLADDHSILRQGLRVLLEKYPDFLVVGEASDGQEARQLAEQLRPDVVILDVGIPGLNAIEVTRSIRSELPNVYVIGLYGRAEKSLMTTMVRAGASGYLFKGQCNVDDLARAIHEVFAGRVYVNPDMMEIILREYRVLDGAQQTRASVNVLDSAEREVLQHLADGSSIKEIAERRNVSDKTIIRSRDRIMQKLFIFSVAGLTKFAIKNGLVSLD